MTSTLNYYNVDNHIPVPKLNVLLDDIIDGRIQIRKRNSLRDTTETSIKWKHFGLKKVQPTVVKKVTEPTL